MMFVSWLGGLICRHYCETDDKGYIITNKNSAFKVSKVVLSLCILFIYIDVFFVSRLTTLESFNISLHILCHY